MPTKALIQDKTLRIVRPHEVEFRAAVVGKDAMSSGLLADALTRDLKCQARGTRPSDLLQALGTGNFDLVIISADISSRPAAGFELVSAVSCAYPKIPIVIMIDEVTKEATINALRSGARGVFNGQMSMSQFVDCVEHVRGGSIWAGPEETVFLLEAFRNVPALGAHKGGDSLNLSTRELQVVQAAASGKKNKAIASELRLSEHTVRNYLFRAFEKLGVSSRVELLFYLTMRGHTFGPPLRAAQEGKAAAD
jgi:two-component system, NarL family, nitrate/nitrite response regulator NarL